MARTVGQIQADLDKVAAEAGNAEKEIRNADGSGIQTRPEADRVRALSALQREMAAAVADLTTTPRVKAYLVGPNSGY